MWGSRSFSLVKPDAQPVKRDDFNQSVLSDISYVDWYGNLWLHHAFANSDPDLERVKQILLEYPESAGIKNQFGRIALHYCLDRIKVNLPSVNLLLAYYPAGAYEKDIEGNTPYDLAVKWKQKSSILLALLRINPQQDYPTYVRLRYGCFGGILLCSRRNGDEYSPRSGDENEIEREAYDQTPCDEFTRQEDNSHPEI